MSTASFFEYPEFLAVALLALLWFRNQQSGAESNERQSNFFSVAAVALLAFMPLGYRQWIATMQNYAAWRTNQATADFAMSKLMIGAACLLLAFAIPPLAALLATAVGYFVPDLFLVKAVRSRQRQIREALPQALDLMLLCVDAGLGLDATVQRVAGDRTVINKALNEELTSLGRDVLLGMDRARAYQELYKRTGVEELKMLGSALNQSTKMGLSIARILRSQSELLRARQSQRSEEKAARLPVWIAFPLWFCIMPSLLFVIIGPSLINFMQHLGNVKPDWFN